MADAQPAEVHTEAQAAVRPVRAAVATPPVARPVLPEADLSAEDGHPSADPGGVVATWRSSSRSR
jgi:hypothetical protein